MTHSPERSSETPATLHAALAELVGLIETSQQATRSAMLFSMMTKRHVDYALFPGSREAVGAYTRFLLDPDTVEIIGFSIHQSMLSASEARDQADNVLDKAMDLMKSVCGDAASTGSAAAAERMHHGP